MKFLNNKLVANSIYNQLAYIINFFINIISIPIILSKLGQTEFGIYILFLGLINYYGILDLGLSQGIIKFVSHYYEKKDKQSLNSTYSSAIILFLIISFFFSLVVLIFSKHIITALKVPIEYNKIASIAILFVAINFPIGLFYLLQISYIQGFQRFDLSSKINTSFLFITNLSSIVLVSLGYRVLMLFTLNLIIQTIFLFLSFYLLKKIYPELCFTLNNLSGIIKKLSSFSFYSFIAKLNNFINTNLSNFIISYFTNPGNVVYYHIPLKIVNSFQGLLGVANSVLLPFISQQDAAGNKYRILSLMKKSTCITISIAAPVYILIIIFSHKLLTMYISSSFADKSFIVLILLAIGYLFSALTIPISNFLYGIGQSKFIGQFTIFSSILSLIFLIYFVKYFGYFGAAIASIVSITTASMLFYLMSKKRLNTYIT